MGTNCAPLVADFFLFCYGRDFMTSFSNDNQAHIIEAFNLISIYLDDLLDINNPYFEGIVNQFFPPELKLNKANTSDTETIFFYLHLSTSVLMVCVAKCQSMMVTGIPRQANTISLLGTSTKIETDSVHQIP